MFPALACVLDDRKSELLERAAAPIWSAVCLALVMRNDVASDGVAAAQLAGLRYASDEQPGVRRRRKGRGFTYVDRDGVPIRDAGELRRIRRLAIPPAWTDVWISPSPLGHIQATGRDARGRKQYRYHERWREVRDEAKYGRLGDFAKALPRVRARVDADLAQAGIPRERVLATAIRILEETFMRVGNVEYARENGSFGLTTLRTKHVDVEGSRIAFRFRGKSGKDHEVDVRDRRLARVSARLGNTRAICRKCYVHPAILEAYLTGHLPSALKRPDKAQRGHELSRHEAAVAALLGRAAKRVARRAA